jgi:hypothetical protein
MRISSSLRMFVVAAGVLAMAGCMPIAAANAATTEYFITDGAQGGLTLFLNDPGVGGRVETTKAGPGGKATAFGYQISGQAPYDGHTTFKLVINDGTDCLQDSSNSYIYDEGCNTNGTNQQFYRVDNYLYSVGLTEYSGTPTALQAVNNTSGSQVVGVIDPTNNPLDQWTFSGIGP